MGFSPLPTDSSLLWVISGGLPGLLPLLGTPSCVTGAWSHSMLFYLLKIILHEERKECGTDGPSPALVQPRVHRPKELLEQVAEEPSSSPQQAAPLPWNMEFQVVLGAVLAENCFKNS